MSDFKPGTVVRVNVDAPVADIAEGDVGLVVDGPLGSDGREAYPGHVFVVFFDTSKAYPGRPNGSWGLYPYTLEEITHD